MTFRKAIRVTVIIFAGIVVVVCLLLCLPGPISGIWFGPPVSCMCDGHNFIVIRDGRVAIYFEGETDQPPPSYSCTKIDMNSWQWLMTLPTQKSDSLTVSIKTNTFTLTPHLLHMRFLNPDGPGENSWFLRDWRRRDASRIVNEQAPPEDTDYFVALLEKALRAERAEDNASTNSLQNTSQ